MIPALDQAQIIYIKGSIIKSYFGVIDTVTGIPYMSLGNIVVDCKTGSGRIIWSDGRWAKKL